MDNRVLAVTFEDIPLSIDTKEHVHKVGKLHRAFSVYIFNNKNEILLYPACINSDIKPSVGGKNLSREIGRCISGKPKHAFCNLLCGSETAKWDLSA